MVDINPVYRNRRRNFYSDKGLDSLPIGSIINTFKVKPASKSYDSQFNSSGTPINNTSKYFDVSGNAFPENNPEYQYDGYLYCDGSEYNIVDYPLLFSVIGNDYGGTPGLAITVLNGGSNYSTLTTVTFSNAPTGGITATGSINLTGGVITGINVSNPGLGYTSPPTITLNNTGNGGGASFKVRINSRGSISAVTKNTILELWPDELLGTFRVPDLKAKKIVGRGPVYGAGTPTIANSELIVGKNSIGGRWYLNKDSQKSQFNIGSVKTIGYENVTDTISASIIGSQTISVKLDEKRLAGAPSHSHYLLHSDAPNEFGGVSKGAYDTYVSGYRNSSGRINPFSPSGGIPLTHSHSLLRKANTNTQFATYDLYNYTGGDIGPGSKNANGNYLASGSSGSFEVITFTPSPTFLTFTSSSIIGGRIITTEGVPTFNYTTIDYNNVGTYTYSIPANIDQITFAVLGGGGSGGVYNKAGNDGGFSRVIFGSNVITVTAGGGKSGKAATNTTGGLGGLGGTNSITGDTSNINIGNNSSGENGGDGAAGPYWKTVNPIAPTGEGAAGFPNGSSGKNLNVTQVVDLPTVSFVYPSFNSGYTIASTSPNYKISSVKFQLYGGNGANCGNLGGNYSISVGSSIFTNSGCTTGVGIPGKYFRIKQITSTLGGTFGIYPGQKGQPFNASAASTYGSTGPTGGAGGNGYESNDGGGGGAGSAITTVNTAGLDIVVAGAGGGGGGGGAGEGNCGVDGRTNPTQDSVQATASSLFFGAGGIGGYYGCTGGGGGGGGGGVGTAGQTGGITGLQEYEDGTTAGGVGGGGGGPGGHGGGWGGDRGISSFRSDIFELEASGNNDKPGGEGQIDILVSEDRSYYSSFAGGGGSGGTVLGDINKTQLTATGISSLTITVGNGGSGVSNSISGSNTVTSSDALNGLVQIRAGVITGYQGGSETISIGDIVESASDGIQIYASGSGTGTAGGFKLPTTQLPTIEITPQGSGSGSGATANAVLSGGAVSSITLTNGGNGYTSPPNIRFLHGAGAGTKASVTLNATGQISGISLTPGSSTPYTRYVKIGGSELVRYIVIKPFDCTNVNRIGVKVARGNNINGGELPDSTSDELAVYYNIDGSNNFPEANFIGIIVPKPSDAEIISNYDGTGSGNEATRWYTYRLNIPAAAQVAGTKFKIVQNRTSAAPGNDNGGNTDHYGICEFFYDYKLISEVQFVATPGELDGNSHTVSYNVEGPANAAYSSGLSANDVKFTMSSSVPILPKPYLDPLTNIPLVEPYMLTKYLIKSY